MWICSKCGREFKKTNQDHFCREKPANIDEYISVQSDDVRIVLTKVRETMQDKIIRMLKNEVSQLLSREHF